MDRLRRLAARALLAVGARRAVTSAPAAVAADPPKSHAVHTAEDLARVFTNPYIAFDLGAEQLIKHVRRFSREDLRAAFKHDPVLSNYVVNYWEAAAGETVLTTYPWKVVLPISDVCNATCTFCNSWLRGVRTLKLAELDRFAVVLRHATEIGLEGHGEPLVNPEIETLIMRLTDIVDRRCWKYMITNGARLDRYFDVLQKLLINNYSISLNAASAKTHDEIMGLGADAFERIVGSIKRLVACRDQRRASNPGQLDDLQVNMTFVVVNQNIHEVPRFIELGHELNVNAVWLRTLLPQGGLLQGLNYHVLPPYENPDFEKHREGAIEAIEQATIRVVGDPASWSAPIYTPELAEKIRNSPPIIISKADAKKNERVDLSAYQDLDFKQCRGRQVGNPSPEEVQGTENPFNRSSPYMCADVYSVWHWNDFLYAIRPCCYMEHPPGYEYLYYDGTYDFFEAWNCPAFVEIRRALRDGPLISWCKRCPTQTQYAAS